MSPACSRRSATLVKPPLEKARCRASAVSGTPWLPQCCSRPSPSTPSAIARRKRHPRPGTRGRSACPSGRGVVPGGGRVAGRGHLPELVVRQVAHRLADRPAYPDPPRVGGGSSYSMACTTLLITHVIARGAFALSSVHTPTSRS